MAKSKLDIFVLILSCLTLGIYFTIQGVKTFTDEDSTLGDKTLYIIVAGISTIVLLGYGMCPA